MNSQKYLLLLPIGDWSLDGHEDCNWYTCEANKPVEQIRETHFKIQKTTGINIHEICSMCNENTVNIDTHNQLKKIGFNKRNRTPDNKITFTPDDMIELWVFLLQKTDPELIITICVEEEIPMLPFYGYDEKNRSFNNVGYGCFKQTE